MIVSNHISILDFLREVNYKLFFHLRTSHLLNSSVSEFQAWTMLSWKVKRGAQWQGWGYGLSCGSLQGFPVAIHRLSVNAKFIKPKRRQAQHWTSHDFLWSLFPWFGDYSITTPCSLMPRTYRRWWEKSLPLTQTGTLEMKGNVYWSQYTPVNEMILQT